MKILYVTMDPLEANTSANIRNRGLVFGLKKDGHLVDSLSLELDTESVCYDTTLGDINSVLSHRYFFKSNSIYQKLRAKKSNDVKVRSKSKLLILIKCKTRQMIKKTASWLMVFDSQKINVSNIDAVRFEKFDYDILISSSDPKSAHLAALRLIKNQNLKVRWIQYWGDPMLIDVTAHNGKLKRYLIKRAEDHLLKKADKIVYTSPLTKKVQEKLFYRYKNKMNCAVQACIESGVQNLEPKSRKMTIGYFGNFNSSIRDIRPLCKAVISIKYHLVVVGDGDRCCEENNEIKFYNRMSYEKVQEMESEVDIIAVVCNKNGTQIPGKFYYIAGSQKPIILILDGEHIPYLKDFFKTFDRYILCENHEESIRAAIKKACGEIQDNKHYSLPEQLIPQYVARKIIE